MYIIIMPFNNNNRDSAGSAYEYSQTKTISNIKVNKLIEENSFYSDDTILTIAILDAALNVLDYE